MSGQRSSYYSQRQPDKPRMDAQRCSGTVQCECTPDALGYTVGKTLGSGTYAKVKAAWSPHQRRMVSRFLLILQRLAEPHPLRPAGREERALFNSHL